MLKSDYYPGGGGVHLGEIQPGAHRYDWWIDASGTGIEFGASPGGPRRVVRDPGAIRDLRDALTDTLVTLQDRDYDRAIRAIQDAERATA